MAYNTSWNENYQSVVAVAAIQDSLEDEDYGAYMDRLAEEWGIQENDMLFLLYDNGKFCGWTANQAFIDFYCSGYYDGLQEILDNGYQPDVEGDYEGALLNFFSYLNECYAAVYDNPVEDGANQTVEELPFLDRVDLIYSSGMGAWQTSLTLQSYGHFEGFFMNSDMGDIGDAYPNGTVYLCDFNGCFKDIAQINEYTYSMTLMEAPEDGGLYITTGNEEWIEDGVRYVPASPAGLDWGTNFLFYTPDTPVSELPVDFLSCWPGQFDEVPPKTLSCYGLYNVDEGSGFFTYE